MIVRDCTILLKSESATLSDALVLYKGDQNIEYTFELKDNAYKFANDVKLGNIVTQLEASYSQILWYKNPSIQITFPIQATVDGKVVLKIEKELIDETSEVGDYDLQIRLFDANKQGILTLPPLMKSIHIKAPLFEADAVDTALTDVTAIEEVGAEEVPFGEDGNYIKTTWAPGMIISSGKLNKIEEAIYKNTSDIKGVTQQSHTHVNKATLDKITDNKITSWDSKAEGNHNHDTVYAKKAEIPVVDVTKQYVDTQLATKSPIHEHPYLSNKTVIPSKTSQLTNDSNFITTIPEEYITESELIAKGYITNEQIKNKVDKEEGKGLSSNDYTTSEKQKLAGLNNYTLPTASDTVLGGVKVGAGLSIEDGVLSSNGGGTADSVEWVNIQNKPSTFPPATHNHSYNDLTEKPVIPTKVSQLQNDSNYASKTDLVNKVDKVKGKSLSTNDLTEELKSNYDSAYAHTQIAHAPSTAQKNSDITLSEIEAKLVGNITTHTHDIYLTEHQDISNLALKSEIVKSYNQLTDKPVIPSIDGLAKETYVDTKVAEIVDSAPETLDTLQELATALGNDPNFATTVANQIGTKASTEYVNAELAKKVNSEGYVATENSYTTVEKTKLQGIQEGANNYVHPAKHKPSDIAEDTTHRFITDAERQTWNNKSEFTGDYNKLTNKPVIPTVSNDLTNTLKANYDSAYTHSQSAHAPSNAQKNSDITALEIEAKLKGNITTHTHSQYLTQHQSLIDYAKKTEIPNRLSQLQNDANYAKESSIDTKISARLGDIKIKKLTKQQYDSIGSKDPNCLYIIIKTM